MNLWIRSQDKERLIKISSVFMEYNGDVDPNIHTYKISGDKCVELGIYKTKERTLEVLDEIQTIIRKNKIVELTFSRIPDSSLDNIKVKDLLDSIVYEMPEE